MIHVAGFLAQYSSNGGSSSGGGGIVGALFSLIYLALAVAVLAGWWKVFVKAGQPGWAAIVPIYNVIVLLQIIGKPLWWIVLLLIPCVNIVFIIIIMLEVAKRFQQTVVYAIGLIVLPFIFVPMLGFGDAQYSPPMVQG